MKKLIWSVAALLVIGAVMGALWVREFRAEMKNHPIGFSGAENMIAPFAKQLTDPLSGGSK